MIRQGGFAFAESLAKTDAEKKNPWLLLTNPTEDGTIPAIVDANSAEWILHIGLGETLETKGPAGEPVKLKIVALLHDSLFQSEVLDRRCGVRAAVSEAGRLAILPDRRRRAAFRTISPDAGPWPPRGARSRRPSTASPATSPSKTPT